MQIYWYIVDKVVANWESGSETHPEDTEVQEIQSPTIPASLLWSPQLELVSLCSVQCCPLFQRCLAPALWWCTIETPYSALLLPVLTRLWRIRRLSGPGYPHYLHRVSILSTQGRYLHNTLSTRGRYEHYRTIHFSWGDGRMKKLQQ